MNTTKIVSLYILLFIATVGLLDLFSDTTLLSKLNFLNWDAIHYFDIKNGNYQGFRTAFFPLFPWIWKFSFLGIYGIVIFNALLYLISFSRLSREFSFSRMEIVLFLSVPSAMFYFLPYTEALFFFFSTIILLGLKKENRLLIVLGLFFCCLTRPSFTILLPALIITVLLQSTSWKVKVKEIAIYFGVASLGILVVGLIQYFYSHEWFQFFSVQKGWGNELQVPKLPLASWGGGFNVRLDGFAFLFCVLVGFSFLYYLIKRTKYSWKISNELTFSISYLIGIALIVLLFRGGSLFSLNRFVFATPFFLLVLHAWLNYKKVFSVKQLILIFVGILLFWFLFGSQVHIQAFLKFVALSCYFFLLFLIKSEKTAWKTSWMWIFIGVNFVFQIMLYSRFLSKFWVG